MKLNKLACVGLAAVVALGAMGCGSDKKDEGKAASGGKIVVVSREDGSGTRGAFIELFGIEQKQGDKKVDMTTESASITNSTAVMMTTVAGNKDAIGYISLGSLNDTVKGLKIDGAEATAANVKSGAYKISRPFNIVTKGEPNAITKDFINFILSKQGQEVVSKAGYIGNEQAANYAANKKSGKIVVAGSSSVTPAMEKLKEAYQKLNPDVNIEVQQSDSTTGVKSAISGICNIGMASRELKKSELDAGVKATVIATDGIAVIVNKDNKLGNMTKAQVADIFTGKVTSWDKLAK
ncbi:MAG: substrate-binding domain-containing protein [Phascolarctobacterium sp.]|uniref:substrate-binding domain-containing protein n=1 Tax=Phascolarctobacterium sp. TaxID=2049039 RepID=UPI0026DB8EDB|nr:substrate-binding domain-containing protein [Phascolarctobacterium sp.]MDO4921128.1 substrate-binding domain-containing protein [Phascolarctobacterium sp.]